MDHPDRRRAVRERIVAAEIKKLELRQKEAAEQPPDAKPDATVATGASLAAAGTLAAPAAAPGGHGVALTDPP